MKRLPPPRRGFTIIEILVVIAVIAVLLGFMLPALSGAKKNAMELAAISHQRQVGSLVRQYGFDRHDEFPFFGVPGTRKAILCLASDDPFAPSFLQGPAELLCGEMSYWDQPLYWVKHMRFLGYDTDFVGHPPERESPNQGRPVVLGTVDLMTYGAYAPPNFWRPGNPQRTEDHNVQRWTSVEFPSDKVILQRSDSVYFADSPDANGWVYSWFADGHVERLNKIDMLPAVPLRLQIPVGFPGLTTLAGLSGRDR